MQEIERQTQGVRVELESGVHGSVGYRFDVGFELIANGVDGIGMRLRIRELEALAK